MIPKKYINYIDIAIDIENLIIDAIREDPDNARDLWGCFNACKPPDPVLALGYDACISHASQIIDWVQTGKPLSQPTNAEIAILIVNSLTDTTAPNEYGTDILYYIFGRQFKLNSLWSDDYIYSMPFQEIEGKIEQTRDDIHYDFSRSHYAVRYRRSIDKTAWDRVTNYKKKIIFEDD